MIGFVVSVHGLPLEDADNMLRSQLRTHGVSTSRFNLGTRHPPRGRVVYLDEAGGVGPWLP